MTVMFLQNCPVLAYVQSLEFRGDLLSVGTDLSWMIFYDFCAAWELSSKPAQSVPLSVFWMSCFVSVPTSNFVLL